MGDMREEGDGRVGRRVGLREGNEEGKVVNTSRIRMLVRH